MQPYITIALIAIFFAYALFMVYQMIASKKGDMNESQLLAKWNAYASKKAIYNSKWSSPMQESLLTNNSKWIFNH